MQSKKLMQKWKALKNHNEEEQIMFLKDLISLYELHPMHYGMIYAGMLFLSFALSIGISFFATGITFWVCAIHFFFALSKYTKKKGEFTTKWFGTMMK